MLRLKAQRCAVVVFSFAFLSARFAVAQDTEETWKNLVMQAVYAGTAKDYAKSEELFLKAVKEAQRFGEKDPRVGSTLNSLGLIYRSEKKFKEAENAYRKALPLLEAEYGSDSIDIANVNFNIASVLIDQGDNAGAISYLHRSLSTYDSLLGSSSVKTASVLCMLGDAYRLTKDFRNAEAPLKRCADIREGDSGVQNVEFADALNSLALTYVGEGKYALAEPRFNLAEKIRENTQGIMSPALAQTLEDHAALLKSMGRDKDAERLTKLAGAIRRTQKK